MLILDWLSHALNNWALVCFYHKITKILEFLRLNLKY